MFLSYQPHIYERDRRLARESGLQRQASDGTSLSPSSSFSSSLGGAELHRPSSGKSTSPSEAGRDGAVDSLNASNDGDSALPRDSRGDSSKGPARGPGLLGKLSLARSRRNLAGDAAAAAAADAPRSPNTYDATTTTVNLSSPTSESVPALSQQDQSGEKRQAQGSSWLPSPLSARLAKGRRQSATSSGDLAALPHFSASNAPPLPADASELVRKQNHQRPPINRSKSSSSAVTRRSTNLSSHDIGSTGRDSSFGKAHFNESIFQSPASDGQTDRVAQPDQGDEDEEQEVIGDEVSPLQASPLRGAIGLPPHGRASGGTNAARGLIRRREEHGTDSKLYAYPLPVRLGLVTPDMVEHLRIPVESSSKWHEHAQSRQAADVAFAQSDEIAATRCALLTDGRPQFCNGYYLVTPPPRAPQRYRQRTESCWSTQASSVDEAPVRSRSRTRNNSVIPSSHPRKQSISGIKAKTRGRPASAGARSTLEQTQSPMSLIPTEARPYENQSARLQTPTSQARRGTEASLRFESILEPPRLWRLQDYFCIEHKKKAGRFGIAEQKKHAYTTSEAPYFMAYGKNTITAELLIHTAVSRIMGLTRVPWHDRRPPRRVLDLGCGSGAWVLDMAKQWPDTEFIGLDLVPCQTPLADHEDESVQRRVSWVVANLLDGLPFADKSFDFVHTSFINTGIPEARWPNVLHDIERILVSDGYFELLEVDWTFYGAPLQMYQADYEALLDGRLKDTKEAISMWESHRVGKSAQRVQRYSDLAPVMRLPYERRKLCLSPTVLLPACLKSMSHLGDAGFGNVRSVPILGRSRLAIASEAAKEAGKLAHGQMHIDTGAPRKAEVVEAFDAFVTHADPDRPLPRHHFVVEDMDALRLAILGADILRNSEIKDLLWSEIQHARKVEGRTGDSSGSRPALGEQPHSSRGEKEQWPDLGEFERNMDLWAADLRGRTDVELLLTNLERWDEAAERMDGWMLEEKQRKSQRRRRWGTGPTPFAHSLSVLPARKGPSSRGSSPSRINSNFMALSPTNDSGEQKSESSMPQPTGLTTHDMASVSDTADESSMSEAEQASSTRSSPDIQSSPRADAKAADTTAAPATLPRLISRTNGEKRRGSSTSSSRDGEQTMSILGFRNVCAWSFHKLPPALEDTPRSNSDRSLAEAFNEANGLSAPSNGPQRG